MCLLTETRALSAQGEKRALVGNLTMPSGTQPLGLAAGDIAQVYLGETRGFRPRSRR